MAKHRDAPGTPCRGKGKLRPAAGSRPPHAPPRRRCRGRRRPGGEAHGVRYRLAYEADRGGQFEAAWQVLEAVRLVRQELAAYCEGDASHAPLGRVDLDLAVTLAVDEDWFDVIDCERYCEERHDGTVLFRCERREHGYGMDLADVLATLDEFGAELRLQAQLSAWQLAAGARAEVSVRLTLATGDRRLAARLGFRRA